MTTEAERPVSPLDPESAVRRVLVFVAAAVAAACLLALDVRLPLPELSEGDVADRDVTAAETFTFVNAVATEQAQQAAEAGVLPVYVADLTASTRLQSQVSQAFDLARRRAAALPPGADAAAQAALRADFVSALQGQPDPADVDVLARAGWSREVEDVALELVAAAMRRHVVQDRAELPGAQEPIVLIGVLGDTRDESVVEDHAAIRTLEEARQAVSLHVVERFGGARDPALVNAAAALARAVVAPDVRIDAATTAARRAAARQRVAVVEQRVQRGTRVVRAGDAVTAQQVALLEAMRAAGARGPGPGAVVAAFGFVLALVSSVVVFAQSTIRKFAARGREREALLFLLVLVLALGRVAFETGEALDLGPPFDADAFALVVPVAGGAMLARILLNSESALVWSIVASVLGAALAGGDVYLGAYYVITAVVATRGVGQGRERVAIFRAGVQSGFVGAALVLPLALLQADGTGLEALDGRALASHAALAVAGGMLNAVLALGTTPAFELFGFTTDYKLLELASLNHPLLRQLMLRAPGTYHHSVIVGTLSEAACEAIGANALLARVACYFHDIGKGLKPQYFVENQRDGQNRHDRMSPEASAAVIINHVREGAALARQHGLPKPIVDNIFMHHGTGIIQYFYARAREAAAPGEVVDDRLFRYPGPRPDSREAGVIMLADKVEAACRTIKEPSEERMRAMIQQIVNGVMNDGQLVDCPLTLKELYVIADVFTNVLMGIHHHRIEYPSTRAISSGGGRLPPVPKQGTITLEILNPLRPPPIGADGAPPVAPSADYESAEHVGPAHAAHVSDRDDA